MKKNNHINNIITINNNYSRFLLNKFLISLSMFRNIEEINNDFAGKWNNDFAGKINIDFAGKRNIDFAGKSVIIDFAGKRNFDLAGKSWILTWSDFELLTWIGTCNFGGVPSRQQPLYQHVFSVWCVALTSDFDEWSD